MFTVRGYPADRVELVDAFVESDFEGPLDKNYLAIGFNFDDGGEPLELGSDLLRAHLHDRGVGDRHQRPGGPQPRQRRARLDGVRGHHPAQGRHRAGAPIIDYLIVDPVRAQRQPVPEPKPWQEFLWIVSIPVVDEYHAREV
jgi:hypothetical protein